jgi:hypothetical protein
MDLSVDGNMFKSQHYYRVSIKALYDFTLALSVKFNTNVPLQIPVRSQFMLIFPSCWMLFFCLCLEPNPVPAARHNTD